MPSRIGTKVWFTVALLAGLLLRIFFVFHHSRFGGDTLLYGDLAHNMLAHHIFGFTEDPAIRSTLIRLPGYPLFLAFCFALFGTSNYIAVLWVQVVMDLATCVLLGVLAGRLLGSRAALATVWFAALCPFTANYSAVGLAECGCLFMAALAFFALERWITAFRQRSPGVGWVCLCGFALIYGILLRPDQVLVAVALVPAMLWIGLRLGRGNLLRRTGPALLVSLFIALPLSLWAVRNWSVYHVFQPLAPRYATDPGEPILYGFQRWYRTWAIEYQSTVNVYWTYDGNSIDLDDLPSRAFDTPTQREQTAAIYAQYNQENASTPQVDDAFARLASERIHLHPLRYYLVLPLARELDMWLRPRTELMRAPDDFWNISEHPAASIAECAYAALNLAYLLLGIAGVVRWLKLRWTSHGVIAFAMLGFVALRCILLLTLDNSEPRYTLECFPVVILFAGLLFAGRQTSTVILSS